MRGDDMDRSKDIMRLTFRLNQRVPEQARIIRILKDLNSEYHTTMTSFIIEAITFYIDNIPDHLVTNAGKASSENQRKSFVTEEALEKRLDQYDQALKRWLLDCFVSFSAGANRIPSPVSNAHSFPGEEDTAPKEYDLTDYPDIMKDINAWGED